MGIIFKYLQIQDQRLSTLTLGYLPLRVSLTCASREVNGRGSTWGI